MQKNSDKKNGGGKRTGLIAFAGVGMVISIAILAAAASLVSAGTIRENVMATAAAVSVFGGAFAAALAAAKKVGKKAMLCGLACAAAYCAAIVVLTALNENGKLFSETMNRSVAAALIGGIAGGTAGGKRAKKRR